METKDSEFNKKKPNLKYVKYMTRLMDSEFKIPGTKFRFGLDPILGLIPGVGDLASYGISGLIILYMARYGASKKVMFKMFGNIALDTIIGSIPIIGHIFDFVYKANERNLKLLQEHYEEGKHQGKGTKYLILFLVIFLLILIVLIALIWAFIGFIISAF